ncbi:MAG: hypothetical protein H0W67_09165 [Gemmatimonadales bacterium]|nr:hypothetical protein [Gemmatimonadales bacterium]
MSPAAGSPLEALTKAWSDIVAEVRARSRFLGEALAASGPAGFEAPWLTLVLRESNSLFAERLQAEAMVIETIAARVAGQPVRIKVTEAQADGGQPTRSGTLSEASIKADRLKQFRARDPALDTAADALDLEIVD